MRMVFRIAELGMYLLIVQTISGYSPSRLTP